MLAGGNEWREKSMYADSNAKACCVSPCLSSEGDKGTLSPMSTSLTSNTSKKRLPVKALKDWREGIEVLYMQQHIV